MKALLIVDIQNDFLPEGALAVPQGDQIIAVINRLQEHFPLVVATQDWHPADHSSFASSHAGRKAFEHIQLLGMDQVLWPDHCVQGSFGAALHESLSTDAVEAIFRKGMDAWIDSYSAFFDNGHQKSTGLADYLKGKGVTEVYISGLAADFCVAYSALDALDSGFQTWVIEDATRPIDPAGFARMKENLLSRGCHFIHSAEIHAW